jgi:hypothetical protein
MRRLMTGYAGAFNIRHWRAGHLFQNRYKSIVCENSPYLLELVRYIHLNPLRAGLVSSLDELQQYPWTGHSVLMGVAERPWQETMEVLSCFSKDIATARKNYETFLAEAKDVKSRRDLMVGGVGRRATGESPGEHDRTELSDERVLGSGGFVEEVLKRSQDKALARAMAWGGIPSLECLTKRVAEKAGVETNDLLAKGRTAIVSRAKAVLIYAGTEYLGKSIEEMAEVTEMSGQAAGKARMRGEGLLTEEEMRELVG